MKRIRPRGRRFALLAAEHTITAEQYLLRLLRECVLLDDAAFTDARIERLLAGVAIGRRPALREALSGELHADHPAVREIVAAEFARLGRLMPRRKRSKVDAFLPSYLLAVSRGVPPRIVREQLQNILGIDADTIARTIRRRR